VYVFAGWLVPDSLAHEFREEATKISAHRKGHEQKASRLLKTESGQRRILAFFESLPSSVIPFFEIAERRYGLAVKINHTLFDAGHNERAKWSQVLGRNERSVAERILSLPEHVLYDFASVYSTPDKERLEAVVRSLSAAARGVDDGELAHWFDGAYEALDDIWDSDFTDSGHIKHYQLSSMNLPIFNQVIRLVDSFMEFKHQQSGQLGTFNIVHDVTQQFSSALEFYAEEFLNDPTRRITIRDFNNHRMAKWYFHSFSTRESKDAPEIQAADLLASSLFRLARDAMDGIAWPAPMIEIAKRFVPVIMDDLPIIGGVFGSEDLMFRLIMGCQGQFFPPRP
jgi:hypothetical protein